MSVDTSASTEGKGLFGSKKSQMAQVIAQHEILQRQAEGRAQAAEARIVELQAQIAELESRVSAAEEARRRAEEELDGTRDELSRKDVELYQAGKRLEVLEANSPTEATTKFLNEELASVLTAAQQAAEQVVERARAQAQTQMADAQRVWGEVEADRARFAEWREEAEPYIRAVQEKVEGVRAKIEEVPIRIRQALDMVIGAVAAMDTDLASIMAVPSPPLLQASTPRPEDYTDGGAEASTGEADAAPAPAGLAMELDDSGIEAAGTDEEPEDA